MRSARSISTIMLTLLAMVGLMACSEKDGLVAPLPPPTPTGTICVDVTPDSCLFTWSLTSADSSIHTGCGDSILTDIPCGDWEIVWNDQDDFFPPSPHQDVHTLAADNTVTFAVTYFSRPTGPLKVLFLGASYFGFNARPDMCAYLVESMGREVEIDGHYPGGRFLDYHAVSQTTEALIQSRVWDYVILQGVGRMTAYPRDCHFDLSATINHIVTKVHQYSSPETKVMYQLPWAFEDGMLWTADGTDDYFAMQQRAYDRTLELAENLDIVIAPVGWAWNTIMLEGPRPHYLFMTDWNHPSVRGSYLMACVFYTSLFRESVVGASYCGNVPTIEAAHFQEVGSNMVLDNLELWHLEGDKK